MNTDMFFTGVSMFVENDKMDNIYMAKILHFILILAAISLSGCKAIENSFGDRPIYQEPSDTKNVSRIRFIKNIRGTEIKQKGYSKTYTNITEFSWRGYVNKTRDIGMPKISYRKDDYNDYYFETKIKSVPTLIYIQTESTVAGSCHGMFFIKPESGKDYDMNFDITESRTKCIMHFNEIVKDGTTGVYILKPAPYKRSSAPPWEPADKNYKTELDVD
ncbi:hypothetical protein [Brenneria uluponensis]|uniref:hypothetical protein n=1 Tax=Brenneria uluponensis TaxID=3057057 RepID=UPI0028F01F8A|nr:hypothetical protein [Brenneria ulupoensis]